MEPIECNGFLSKDILRIVKVKMNNCSNIIYITCLKYSVGLFKDIILIGNKLKEHGYDVVYLAALEFKPLFDKIGCIDKRLYITKSKNVYSVILDYLSFSGSTIDKLKIFIESNQPKLFFIYNFHPINIKFVEYLKSNHLSTLTAFYLHHPPGFPKSEYGIAKAIMLYAYDYLQSLLIKQVDHIVLPSINVASFFHDRFQKAPEKIHFAPLLVTDIYKRSIPCQRQYFTYVGGINSTTGLDIFIKLINIVQDKNLSYRFLIITSSTELDRYLKLLNHDAHQRLKIIHKDYISDEEICDAISNSVAVCKLNKLIEQSGIVPQAYMLATPIICSDAPGITQDVIHKNTGYIVKSCSKTDEMLDAMEFIYDNINMLSLNARRYYEVHFSDKLWEKYYNWIL